MRKRSYVEVCHASPAPGSWIWGQSILRSGQVNLQVARAGVTLTTPTSVAISLCTAESSAHTENGLSVQTAALCRAR
jgi:hypothetical protein